jgi:DNA polymerase epsilon subunit 4
MSDIHNMEVDDADQADSSPGTPPPPPPEDKPLDQPKDKATVKATAALVRESGKSLLPISRVQKIMKADKVRGYHALHLSSNSTSFQELPMVAKEATFIISLATEEFIKRFSEASYHIAHREKRVTVQQRDIGTTRCVPELLVVRVWLTKPDNQPL